MAPPRQQRQLHRNQYLDPSGAQRLLPPEPILHRLCAEAETHRCPSVPPTRRKHFPDNSAPLSQIKELRQPDGRLETANASVPDPRRSREPLPGRGIDLEILQHRRGSRPRCGLSRHRRRGHVRSNPSRGNLAQARTSPAHSCHQRDRPDDPRERGHAPARLIHRSL